MGNLIHKSIVFAASFLWIFFLGIPLHVYSQKDSIISNISINFRAEGDKTPTDWKRCLKKKKCRLVALKKEKQFYSFSTLSAFINNYYPKEFLTTYLQDIYVLDTIIQEGAYIGGKANYLEKYVIVVLRDSSKLRLNQMLNTLHHELSHNIMNSHRDVFPIKEWEQLNKLDYGKGGLNTIKKNILYSEYDSNYCKQGFINLYASSSEGEDFASFAENLFLNHQEFWKLVDTYPLIAQKKDLTIAFYHSLNTIFTEEYFKNLPIIE
jgi:hypothetical protein